MIDSSKVTGVLYAVFKIDKKFKNTTEVKGFQRHMEREQDTPNADPELSKYNRILIGSNDVFGDVKRHIEGIKLRKDGVVATDLLLTASHEYFKNISDEQKESWVQKNIEFLKEKFGENCTYATLHVDEKTWHIHALVSARFRDEKRNRYVLANKRYFGSPQKLSEWQDAYSEAMKEFNLNRGIRFSKAKHVRIRQFYSLIEGNINYSRLNEIVGIVLTHEKIKSDFDEVIEKLNEIKTNKNLKDIKKIKGTLWELSMLSTQPDKFKDMSLVEIKFQEVRNAIKKAETSEENISNLIDNLNDIYKELKEPSKEDFKEMFSKLNEQILLRDKVIQLQKTLNLYATKDKENLKVQEKIREELEEIKNDKEIYRKVIKTLSQAHYLPQNAIENIIAQISKEVGSETLSKVDYRKEPIKDNGPQREITNRG